MRLSGGPLRVERFRRRYEDPTALAFLPKGLMLIAERAGRVLLRRADDGHEVVGRVPRVRAGREGGLLDVALDPTPGRTLAVFLSIARPEAFSEARAAIVRTPFDAYGGSFGDTQFIWSAPEALEAPERHGGRMLIAPDGTLFLALGDRGDPKLATDETRTEGKLMRLTLAGGVPADNPRLGPDAAEGIWALGFRDPRGLALRPTDGRLWLVDRGGTEGDRLDRVLPGLTYGGLPPRIERSAEGGRSEAGQASEGATRQIPVESFGKGFGAAGLAFLGRGPLPGWEGDLIVGSARGLVRLRLAGEKVAAQERLALPGIGPVADVKAAADGSIWVLGRGREAALHRLAQV